MRAHRPLLAKAKPLQFERSQSMQLLLDYTLPSIARRGGASTLRKLSAEKGSRSGAAEPSSASSWIVPRRSGVLLPASLSLEEPSWLLLPAQWTQPESA